MTHNHCCEAHRGGTYNNYLALRNDRYLLPSHTCLTLVAMLN